MSEEFLREAIRLAREGVASGRGGPFGAVVVREGEIVGRGCNEVTSRCDPTAHAEVQAIRDACSSLGRFHLRDCTIYTSCEPCPMCLAAIYWARIENIHYACTREDAARVGFDDELLYRELPLPIAERSVRMHQSLRDEGLAAMRDWEQLEGRTDY